MLPSTFICMLALVIRSAAPSSSPAAMDALLDRLVGRWRMTGSVRGRPVAYDLEVARTLRRRFVELHMTDVQRPPAYEARVFVGVDSLGGRYLAHWLDSTGARHSIPPATGEIEGDTLRLHFDYADGPFRDTFVYDRGADRWRFRLESGDAGGGWQPFADYDVRRH